MYCWLSCGGEFGDETDGIITLKYYYIHVPLMITEPKQELGDDDCDASVQAALRMCADWRRQNVIFFHFGLALLILIRVGGTNSQQMLLPDADTRWWRSLACSSRWRIHRQVHRAKTDRHDMDRKCFNTPRNSSHAVAPRFHCTSKMSSKLANYYVDIAASQHKLPAIDVRKTQPHPRLYPYLTSFQENEQTIRFKYVRALVNHPSCVTFQAKTRSVNPEDIVIKFVSEYGKDVHVFLAELGHTPRLRFYGPLPDKWSILADTQEMLTEDVMDRRLLKMVVMDYIEEGEEPKASVARQQVSDVLDKLHSRGFVLGDLRRDNILFDKTGKARFIDFDWAGPYRRDDQGNAIPDDGAGREVDAEYAHYPLALSADIKWPEGATDLVPILPEHDRKMLNLMYPE
ncbi:hypothetical protein AX17_002967 [Amanita inopinata Kibby_2008]|nr:hypothetical protein AX17_002967 [Amanita inopinata Kibby_2008]